MCARVCAETVDPGRLRGAPLLLGSSSVQSQGIGRSARVVVSTEVVGSSFGTRRHGLARARRAGWVCALALLCCALGRGRGSALDAPRSDEAPAASDSTSSGLPWDGRLHHPVRLEASEVVHPVAAYVAGGNFYGTSELVSLIKRAANAVAARWPGSKLAIGELSAARGGKLDGHHSHHSGRDADLAFYMLDEQGRASHFRRFVTFGSEGLAVHVPQRLRFDDAKNWALVTEILRDREAQVQYMFVANAIRTRLLMEGRREGESDEFLRAAAAVLVEPKEGSRHANHFHVRIYCPRDDRPTCRDSAPYWPWYDGNPPDGERAELPIIRWRTPNAAATRTPKQQATGSQAI